MPGHLQRVLTARGSACAYRASQASAITAATVTIAAPHPVRADEHLRGRAFASLGRELNGSARSHNGLSAGWGRGVRWRDPSDSRTGRSARRLWLHHRQPGHPWLVQDLPLNSSGADLRRSIYLRVNGIYARLLTAATFHASSATADVPLA